MSSVRNVLFAIAGVALLAGSARGEVDKKTERTWKSKCSTCHGAEGKGDTDQGKKLGVKDYSSPAWQASKTDEQIHDAIQNGVTNMDGYKDKLDEAQIKNVVELVRSLKK